MPVRDYPPVRHSSITTPVDVKTPLQFVIAMLGGSFFADMVIGSNQYAEKKGLNLFIYLMNYSLPVKY